MPLSIVAIRDENSDSKYDRLDPALDFSVAQIARDNGSTTITWNSVPGRTYQLEYADSLAGPWSSLNSQRTAGPVEITLAGTDASAARPRFYRVRLVNS